MADLRTQRTKKAIVDAFVMLVNQHGFLTETVTEIAKRAMINRQTFYNYYEDKYDLARRLADETLTKFEAISRERLKYLRQQKSVILLFQSAVVKEMLVDREQVLALLKIRSAQANFRERLQLLMSQALLDIDGEFSSLEINVLSNVFIEIFTYCFEHNRLPTETEVKHLRAALNKVLR
ncbi:TetR/AcrR family transcriptional regulator [Lactobacillus sp. 3B(2020)]|uniref:TetR/AcrR family transcriptional regulator n=1 Tax=Lactobacillus sp. 3B(2020) TaxID=2695882 RepID=UPI0015DEC1F9|nr:TetR family transcriptional regulator [Lactobacillus sp. 3B(2020)]QLL70907.1 TetR family transcriptional regulator [Lactobacillus sp. 3B(2020)]